MVFVHTYSHLGMYDYLSPMYVCVYVCMYVCMYLQALPATLSETTLWYFVHTHSHSVCNIHIYIYINCRQVRFQLHIWCGSYVRM
jgi:hypothetical protein